MRVLDSILIIAAFGIAGEVSAQGKTVYSRTKLPALGTAAGSDNPSCTAVEQAKNLGKQIEQKALDAVGKATSGLGLGSDPFNTRRLNNSVCADLCVVIPTGASFKAKGSVTPIDWLGDLPSGLPGTVNPGNWAAVTGPAVDSTPRGDVVCYTFKNWSHDQVRNVGLEVTY